MFADGSRISLVLKHNLDIMQTHETQRSCAANQTVIAWCVTQVDVCGQADSNE